MATSIGYILKGPGGAVVPTLAIFAPSFLFIVLLNPQIQCLRASAWTSSFLDAINVSAVGLIGAVLVRLGQSTLAGWQTCLIVPIVNSWDSI